MEIKIAYNCKVFAKNYDENSIKQVTKLSGENEGNIIRIMPDYHLGKGCVIGTTMKINNQKVNPSHVGVDIGCGMTSHKLPKKLINLEDLDRIIRRKIPHGMNSRNTLICDFPKLKEIHANIVNEDRILKSIGTLGSGNHFIELGETENEYFLTVHSGSRNLGKQISDYWQKKADERYCEIKNNLKQNILKNDNKIFINENLKKLEQSMPKLTKGEAYLTEEDLAKYMADCTIATEYAKTNRRTILKEILIEIGIEYHENFVIECVHNYISEDGYLRKGAIEAKYNEVLIPINMRDGIIYGKGKNNKEWNYSAPHGAGRVYGRIEAKKKLSMDEFTKVMVGVHTTCVNEQTLDESPMAYKTLDDIISCIGETVEIIGIITPIYNFKSDN